MPVLPKLLDHIFGSSPDSQVYFFGSGDYAKMIEQTKSFHDAPARFEMNKARSNTPAVRERLRVIVKRLYGFEPSEPSG